MRKVYKRQHRFVTVASDKVERRRRIYTYILYTKSLHIRIEIAVKLR